MTDVRAPRSPRSPAGAADFTLEDLRTEDGRLVVEGRWSGTRGLRFVRPTLVLPDREVLATLDHKPWAPAEGSLWVAAFPYDGPPVDRDDVVLAVSPSVTVPLGHPAGRPAREQRLTQARAQERRRESEALRDRRRESEIEFLRSRVARLGEELTEREAAAAPVEGEDDDAARRRREEADNLQAARQADNVARLRAEDERADAVADRDLARREADEALRRAQEAEREARRASEQRDAALAELQALRAELGAARAERDAEHEHADQLRAHRDDALVAFRALERRGLRPAAAGAGEPPAAKEREASPGAAGPAREAVEPDPPTADRPGDAPLGVVSVPAARDLAPDVHHADRSPTITVFDVWAVRILGGVAAVCFVTLMVLLLRLFV